MTLKTIKATTLIVAGLSVATAGWLFREHRIYKEAVVVNQETVSVTVKKLSDYDALVKDTVNDANVYVFDSGVPGGTIFLIGGAHPEEPASNLTTLFFVENMKVTKGRVIVMNRINTSGSQYTRLGEAYPRFFHVETPWGTKRWRMGDRTTNPLDSWPDPEVYIHYPDGQNLAYMDIRNLNRNWPGRKNGLITEQTCYAALEMIKKEGANLCIDFHEAELEYPVENTIVAHQRGSEVAAMTSMMLTAQTFDVPIGMEFSPTALRGLSHREIGDFTPCVSYLMEVAEPMLDRIRGITDEELLMSGRDRFVMKAGDHKLLYAPIDEKGWPIDKRVARHVTAALNIIQVNNMLNPDQEVLIEGMPSYEEILAKGIGAFYHDPSKAAPNQLYYD